MISPHITLNLSGSGGSSNPPRLLLEQAPVAAGDLSLVDLANMLAMVRAGISAKTYVADSCAASVVGGLVVAQLTLYVWPSLPDQAYTLTAAIPEWTEIATAVAVEQERDFDLVVEMTDTVDLPCLAADLVAAWQSPAITARGVVVDPPAVSGYDVAAGKMVPLAGPHGPINRLRLDREIFGVLRIRCRALGYKHALTMHIPKTAVVKITDIEEVITAAWTLTDATTETATQDITLPACVATLLEACPDGSTIGDRGSVTDDEDELIPQLRYNTCTGQPLGIVRMVKP
jgi:hypothetical protein